MSTQLETALTVGRPEGRAAALGVELLPLSPEAAPSLAAGDRGLYAPARNADTAAPLIQDVAAAHLALYARTGAGPPWIGYLARDPVDTDIVGTCGFKDTVRDGVVEIAYFTFPAFEGRRWGSRMAASLVAIASAQPAVSTIRAHTLPTENASTRILRRLGFGLIGTVEDPEDGPVWRWEQPRVAAVHLPGFEASVE